MPAPSYQLRTARAEDHDFLWSLKQRTMRAYVEQTWGQWNEIEQKIWFSKHFLPDAARIIVVGGQDAGRLEVVRTPMELVLGTIEILPEFQGKGVGAAVIAGVQTEARAASLPLRLQVLKTNPRARQLYVSLGFRPRGETITHYLMSWLP